MRSELLEGADELAEWAQARQDFFHPIDEATIHQFGPLTSWVMSGNFTAAAQTEFAGDQADYLLVAYGKAHDHTVVTHELSEPRRRSKVKIPDACIALGVTCATPFDMLRQCNATLQLGT